MTHKYIAVTEILMELEKDLREMYLWDFESPSAEALASTEPFAIDTLNFSQWLQFIFIPRLYLMIEHGLPLPNNCDVAPMAEEYFQSVNINSTTIIRHLKNIDSVLTDN